MRIAIATFGSAGDLFPLIPIARALEQRGDSVEFLCPRALTGYLRLAGLRSRVLGSGTELAALKDADLHTPEGAGWRSWELTFDRYIAPTLADDNADARKALEVSQPDLMITSSFASATRIAGLQVGIPQTAVSLYPQHAALCNGKHGDFARIYREEVNSLLRLPAEASNLDFAAWGISSETRLLHDEALLDRKWASPFRELAAGFPLWDELPVSDDPLSECIEWLAAENAVLVAFGSWFGLRHADDLRRVATSCREQGLRPLVIGAPKALHSESDSHTRFVGYVPLSRVAPHTRLVVHHGAIGTTFGTLISGRACVVVPQAFDQFYTAALLVQAGVGVRADRSDVGRTASAVLNAERFHTAAAELVSRLTPMDRCLDSVLKTIQSAVTSRSL